MSAIVVVRFDWPDSDASGAGPRAVDALRAALAEAAAGSGDIALYRSVPGSSVPSDGAAARSAPGRTLGYAFAAGAVSTARLARAIAGLPLAARVSRLAPILALAGASRGEPATWRYIVETDVDPAHEADFNAWYDTEHLAGLASVPGTAGAARYRDLDARPRYVACYDLARREAFNSAAWLAVRATPWSSRVRPSFRNTRRTMFRREN